MREKCYKPDFGQIGKLFSQEFGNDIDLALRNPAYRPLLNANENDLQPINTPLASDEQLSETFIPRELTTNELREVAIHSANEYQKHKMD